MKKFYYLLALTLVCICQNVLAEMHSSTQIPTSPKGLVKLMKYPERSDLGYTAKGIWGVKESQLFYFENGQKTFEADITGFHEPFYSSQLNAVILSGSTSSKTKICYLDKKSCHDFQTDSPCFTLGYIRPEYHYDFLKINKSNGEPALICRASGDNFSYFDLNHDKAVNMDGMHWSPYTAWVLLARNQDVVTNSNGAAIWGRIGDETITIQKKQALGFLDDNSILTLDDQGNLSRTNRKGAVQPLSIKINSDALTVFTSLQINNQYIVFGLYTGSRRDLYLFDVSKNSLISLAKINVSQTDSGPYFICREDINALLFFDSQGEYGNSDWKGQAKLYHFDSDKIEAIGEDNLKFRPYFGWPGEKYVFDVTKADGTSGFYDLNKLFQPAINSWQGDGIRTCLSCAISASGRPVILTSTKTYPSSYSIGAIDLGSKQPMFTKFYDVPAGWAAFDFAPEKNSVLISGDGYLWQYFF